jgi:tRNA(adenine34) deaminase
MNGGWRTSSDEGSLRLAREAARGRSAGGGGGGAGRRGDRRGANCPISTNDPAAHAEISRCRRGGAGHYRLEGAVLYCTIEPCVMCAGALVAARVARLVFGARDLRFGGVRSKFRVADSDVLNHRVEVVEGVLGAECAALLQEFLRGEGDRLFGDYALDTEALL